MVDMDNMIFRKRHDPRSLSDSGSKGYGQRIADIQFQHDLYLSTFATGSPNKLFRVNQLQKMWDRLKENGMKVPVFEYAAKCQDTERIAIRLNQKWKMLEREFKNMAGYPTVWLVLAKTVTTQEIDNIDSFEDRARVFLKRYKKLERAGFNNEIKQNAIDKDNFMEWAAKTKEMWDKLRQQGIEKEVLSIAVYYTDFESKSKEFQVVAKDLIKNGCVKALAYSVMNAKDPYNEAKRIAAYKSEFGDVEENI